MAKYIGTSIIDKPDSEIQKIAYKSWQEETPNNSDNLNKQGQKYVRWLDRYHIWCSRETKTKEWLCCEEWYN